MVGSFGGWDGKARRAPLIGRNVCGSKLLPGKVLFCPNSKPLAIIRGPTGTNPCPSFEENVLNARDFWFGDEQTSKPRVIHPRSLVGGEHGSAHVKRFQYRNAEVLGMG